MKDSLSSPLRVDLESVLMKLSSLAIVDIFLNHYFLCRLGTLAVKCTRPNTIVFFMDVYIMAKCFAWLGYDSS